MRQKIVEGMVFIQPFCGCFGSHLGNAGNVIGAIANQRQIINDLLRVYLKFGFYALTIQTRAGHGIDQTDMRVDQLRHILVASGDQHGNVLSCGLYGKRTDHVIRFNTIDTQHGQSHRLYQIQQGLGLRTQVVWHRWSMCLVLFEQLITKGFAGRIKYHGNQIRFFFLDQLVQHVGHTQQRAGWFTPGIA